MPASFSCFVTLAVKLETTHKPSKPPTNHPKTTQTSHRPANPPLNHPQTSQTSHKPAKHQSNHPLISQKLHPFFLKKFFIIRFKFRTHEPQHLCPHEIQHFYPSCTRREMGAFFYIPARFHIPSSSLHSSLPSLTADCNSSHKLSTQLQTFRKSLDLQFYTEILLDVSTLKKFCYKQDKTTSTFKSVH